MGAAPPPRAEPDAVCCRWPKEKAEKAAEKQKRESENKIMTAEEKAAEEARRLRDAKEKVKKKAEKRRKQIEEERQRKLLMAADEERAAEETRIEVEQKLEELRGLEASMSKEHYVLERIRIKSATIDFDAIGRANGKVDDLQQIDGIDPSLEEKLNALGISTLGQLAKLDDDMADTVNDAIEYFPGRIKRQLWVEQARILTGQ